MFHRTDTQEEFPLALFGVDLADRARVMVTAHCGVSSNAVSLWFNCREILDCAKWEEQRGGGK
jgi:hypothetical protein